MYSIFVDWREEYERNSEKWENVGRRIIEEECPHLDHRDDNNMRYKGWCTDCGYSEDSAYPMMNYAYPLETHPDDDKVLEVLEKTNCTVMYNTEDDKYYLALTGGGMDLSQDIARAYQIIENWIPMDLLINVCTQPELSMHGKEWRAMAQQILKQLDIDINSLNRTKKRWEEAIKEHEEIMKRREAEQGKKVERKTTRYKIG